MSKHTPGPWINSGLGTVEAKGELPLCYRHAPRDGLNAICYLTGYFGDQQESNANLIAAAPDLLAALEGLMGNEHQSAFEHWLVAESPSGDCESVQAQWLESSEYSDFIDLYSDEMNAIARAKGESQ